MIPETSEPLGVPAADGATRRRRGLRRPPPKRETTQLARRQRRFVFAGILALGIAIGGLGASTFVKSPAEVAADQRPPKPSILTAPVVRQVLSATLVMRGSFSGGPQQSFTPTSAASSSAGAAGTTLIVTGVYTSPGAQATAGKTLLEVDERPIFALAGAFPAYRDMTPGETGKDIEQLQQGLTSLGYRDLDRKGYFGPGTQTAVRNFYKKLGYAVPMTATPTPASSSSATTATPDPKGSTAPAAPTTQPYVPMAEVAFLPSLPAQVAATSAQVGSVVAAPLISFTTSGVSLTAKLDPASQSLVKTGMTVAIVSETSGFTAQGTVTSVGATPVTSGSDNYVPLGITGSSPWPRSELGDDVRVTITTASTGTPVLAVPEAAITSTADGRTEVSVVKNNGDQMVVEVIVGVSANGMVAVTPLKNDLNSGDEVVTGH